jgi:SPP1 gp7 family putative phage head morphogenesis protein
MLMPTKPVSIGFNVSFNEAIAQAVKRGVVLPDIYYGHLQGLARQQAFSIAGITSLDTLQAVKDSLDKVITEGGTFGAWKKQMLESGTLNLPKHRLDNIYRTNLQGSYMAARWDRILLTQATRPYIMYDAINDSRVRPAHLALDGIIRRVDDPFWITHSPPNGYRCRCSIRSLSEHQAKARSAPGKGLNNPALLEDGTPALPDKGWDYNPSDRLAGVNKALADKRTKSSPVLMSALDDRLKAPDVFWQAGTQQAPWHDASFADSPDWIKGAIKKHDGDFQGLHTVDLNDGAYYQSSKIHMKDYDINDPKRQATWRHEYGHYLDMANSDGTTRLRSSMPDFTDAMNTDTKAIVNASGYGRTSKKYEDFIVKRAKKLTNLKSEIEALTDVERSRYLSEKAGKIGLSLEDVEAFFVKETVHVDAGLFRDIRMSTFIEAIETRDAATFMTSILTDYELEDRSMFEKGLVGLFTDTVGSATKNKLLGYDGPYGGSGHPTSYYKKRAGYGQQTEVFANLTSLLGSDSKVWTTAIHSFYPTLTELFKDILK